MRMTIIEHWPQDVAFDGTEIPPRINPPTDMGESGWQSVREMQRELIRISEAYKRVGLDVGMKETQNGRLYKSVKDRLDRLLKPGGVAICCGWNSAGFGKVRGYELREILLVAHGGAHNDTIVTVEVKG